MQEFENIRREITCVQYELLHRYLTFHHQPFHVDNYNICIKPLYNEQGILYSAQYVVAYLDYHINGMLMIKNNYLESELCRDMLLGKEKFTLTRHDEAGEFVNSGRASIQDMENRNNIESFQISLDEGIWLPNIISREELQRYKTQDKRGKDLKKYMKVR